MLAVMPTMTWYMGEHEARFLARLLADQGHETDAPPKKAAEKGHRLVVECSDEAVAEVERAVGLHVPTARRRAD